ncbi:AAA family ATPase, partial [Streptomyces sp. UNOC14_S4]|uniref:AAA family ATPase n=1 Tax=Streptomyces sp. UNOC14_S4 TaxID=2872340 RepID=UPI001E4E6FD4
MRLHRLTIEAFGPFGAKQQIDFDELAAGGLFLLHGPTGAGKTSVLDAVCYALYGGVPGARQGSGLALRSDHAAPGTRTRVTLDLTVGGRRLEITRRPEQLRPKQRGAGFTRERAHSELSELGADGQWHGLSRSHQEIGEEIAQLIGMSREQFCQVVLLPQGDFARFLRAEDTARGKLLGKLFDTSRFAAVEEHLAELRRAAEQQVHSGDEQLLALLHRMQQAVGDASLPTPGAPALVPEQRTATSRTRTSSRTAKAAGASLSPGDAGLAEAVLEWAALARASARERYGIAAVALRTAEEGHRAAQRHAEATRELAALQHRHATARQRAAGFDGSRAEREELRGRLERAVAAAAVVPALELYEEAGRAHRAAADAERRA